MADTTNTERHDAQQEAIKSRLRQRSMDTRRSVVWGERIARSVITVGGLMVIVAVAGIMIFLVQVVMPLMAGGQVEGNVRYQLDTDQDTIWVNGDEFQTLGGVVGADGRVIIYHIPSGTEVDRGAFDFNGAAVTSVSGTLDRDQIAFGFDDGAVRFATLGFTSSATSRRAMPPEDQLIRLDDRDRMLDGRVFTQVGTGDFRTLAAEIEIGEATQISEHPIIAIDYRVGGTVERPTIAFATVDSENQGRVSRSRVQRNMMTGEETITTTTVELPSMDLEPGVAVTGILMSGTADRAIVSTDDGLVYRYDLRDFNNPTLAERRRVSPPDVAVTAMTLLGGEQSLVVGGEDGSVSVFFRLQRAGADTADGFELVRARDHRAMPAAVVDLSEARRQKEFSAVDAEGNVWVYHSTSDQILFEFARGGDVNTDSTAMIFPRSDGVMLVSQGGEVEAWQYRVPHPEVTWRVLFGEIWYEGYERPDFVWQSTAGTDLAEPKYSLVPLIFGTIKAAFYAMLFATPIALMAATYTSEFVHGRVRATVKPMMEMMESLPTVVLGFVAALVLAPIVEEWIGAVLLGFIAVPLGLMLGAFIWQSLPTRIVLKYDGMPKFILMGVTLIVFTWLAYNLGPLFEQTLFYGDFKAWTSGRIGTGTPFMFIILLPLAYLAVAWTFRRTVGHHYSTLTRSYDRATAGRIDVVRWLAMLVAAFILSWATASFLTLIGYDPRGGFVDSYQQRNALVV
ncbi:MAG: hypothetical protein JJU21_14755, partial [Salinarimonas sp.]|nr:hypothetical protein [Salinarimonas sp.]